MTEVPAAETLKRAYGWGNPTKGWLYFFLGTTTVLLLAGVASVSRGGIPNGLTLALLFWVAALIPSAGSGARFPRSKKPAPEWAPQATPAAVGGILALIASTIATGLDGDNQQLKDWIFYISMFGIVLSVMLLPVGWHGDTELQQTKRKLQARTAQVTAKTVLLAEKDTTITGLNEKIKAKTALLAEKDTTIAILTEQIRSGTTPVASSSLEALLDRVRQAVGTLLRRGKR